MIYIVRHAPTPANMSGKMVKDYDSQEIIPFKKDEIKIKLPEVDTVYVSDTIRAKQTAKVLYPNADIKTLSVLNEFNCSGIGDDNFWELSQEVFNSRIWLSGTVILSNINSMIKKLYQIEKETGKDIVCISHGMKIRALIHYLDNVHNDLNGLIFNPYRLINSLDEQFRNLDVIKISEDFKYEIFRTLEIN